MGGAVGKAHDLVFNRRAIARADALNQPAVHGRQANIVANHLVGLFVGGGNPAHLLCPYLFRGHKREKADWLFAGLLFHFATGAAIFTLRKKAPGHPRPYRVWGYPMVPVLFLLATAILLLNTLLERPVESVAGLGLVLLGLPVYFRSRGLLR